VSRPRVEVKRQSELGSRQWGVYVEGSLAEGGFFSRGAADACADFWRTQPVAAAAAPAGDALKGGER
jgi:hypothetical protein